MRNPFSRGGAGRPFRAAPQAQVDDELRFHLEQRIRDYESRGMTPEAARAAAHARFGDVGGVRRECAELLAADHRAADRRDWLDDFRQDLRYGVRSLRRAPVFTLLAIVTLALGIGANAAVFGVVKSVLLDALPYADADRVVRIYARWADGTNEHGPHSVGTIRDLRERQRSFAHLAAFMGWPHEAVFTGDDAPQAVQVAWVEPDLFRTLGVAAARGRALREDDAGRDTAYNVVLTHASWQRLFGGDSAIVGLTAIVNGIRRNVVGVLPRDFVGPLGAVDFYFPLTLAHHAADPSRVYGRQFLGLAGRLKPGVTHETAQLELAALSADIAREQPEFNRGVTVVALPVRDAMVGDARTPLLVLMASAGLVLLITCANLAGALLSRTLSRRKEFAVRAALGAGRGRLVRQLLTESTLLAVAGGVAGVLLATLGLRVLRGLASTALPPYADLTLDRGALLFAAIVALLTGIAFGLAPALSVSRANVQGTLRDEGRGSSESRRSRHLRGMLVAGQLALCVSLLTGAGLLARSLWAMAAAPLGFAPEGVVAVSVQLPPGQRYGAGEARFRFIDQFEERLRGLPGVVSVGTTGEMPTRVMNRNGVLVEGAPPPSTEARPWALYHTVTDDYFRTLGIPLRSGRAFSAQDHAEAPQVVAISEGMAREFWPRGDALGKRFKYGPDAQAPWVTVIAIVGDVANDAARLKPEHATYAPMRQAPWNGPIFMVRARGDLAGLAGPMRQALTELDPAVPLREVTPMPALLADGLSGRRLPVLLMAAFGALALLLASVGVYAMFASMAAAREREFGVRVALGASPRGIATLVLRQGGTWLGVGLLAGAAGVVAVSRLVRGLLYGVAPFDPVALGTAALLLVLCAAVALMVPVRRATRVDPISVLR